MAPVAPRSDRATRTSTRSQTAKSRDITRTSKDSTAPKESRRIEKPRTKATGKTKTPVQPKQKPAADPKPKHLKQAAEEQETSELEDTPQNATILTINDDRLKSPIICHQYTPLTKPPTPTQTPLIFTHGAGGTLSAPAVVHFCTGFSSAATTPVLAFQGSMNLGARVKGFQACYSHTKTSADGAQKGLLFGGRSMGARAAVMAATEIAAEGTDVSVRLVLVSYPLQGPKDVRDRILLDLPDGVEVLFVIGERDAMCPLNLLEEVRGKMKAVSRVVIVRGADHGMNVRPARRTKEVGEETGRVAARWLGGEVEKEAGVMYVGDEE
ncbi:hypothetical protein SVAN01_05076 [Stagonosporopsis vannaccii]|nr:hypothetical protein SVAN01_05076 [Stagonosporopsis vannaccii]